MYTQRAKTLGTELIEKFKESRGKDPEFLTFLKEVEIETRKMEIGLYRKSRVVFPEMVQDLKELTFIIKDLIEDRKIERENKMITILKWITYGLHPIKAFKRWREVKHIVNEYLSYRQKVLRTYGFLIRMDHAPGTYKQSNIPRFKGEFDWYVNLIKQGKTCIDD